MRKTFCKRIQILKFAPRSPPGCTDRGGSLCERNFVAGVRSKFGKPYFTTTMRWGVAMRGGPWLFPRPSANNGAPCVVDPCGTTYSVHVPFLATVRLVHQNKLTCAGLESIELFAAHRPL